MWKPGDVVSWRGIRNNRVWHVQPTIVVKDTSKEIVLTLLPGTECMAEKTYPHGKRKSKRWWDFKNNDWKLAKYTWHTNRFLLIFESQKYYSTILFWNQDNHEFLCYYINFQIPFQRRYDNVDTLDLELDLIVNPDFSMQWKDEEEYQMAIDHGFVSAEWVKEIENAKPEILERIEKRQYPFDGSWLNWKPNPNWSPPKLPRDWDKI
jgi:predicted RNA-binding protein associated with RNAse of E/G family